MLLALSFFNNRKYKKCIFWWSQYDIGPVCRSSKWSQWSDLHQKVLRDFWSVLCSWAAYCDISCFRGSQQLTDTCRMFPKDCSIHHLHGRGDWVFLLTCTPGSQLDGRETGSFKAMVVSFIIEKWKRHITGPSERLLLSYARRNVDKKLSEDFRGGMSRRVWTSFEF